MNIMYSEILDDESEDKVFITKFVWKPRIVLAILWVVIIWRFVEFPYFDFKLIWSVLGLIIATYYALVNSSISIYATFILLGLGMFNVINHFTSYTYLSFGPVIISLNYLGLLFLHATINSLEWLRVLRALFGIKSGNPTKKEKSISENRFMIKFKNKTYCELRTIIESPQYSKDAIEAAKELLRKRKIQ